MSSQQSPLQETSDVVRASRTLERAFAPSKSSDYLFKKFFNVPITEKCSRERIDAMIHYYTAMNHDLGAHITEVNNFDGAAIWTAPGQHLPAKPTNDPQFNDQFFTQTAICKKNVLPEGMDYYYLFMIGKDLSHPEIRGSARAILTDLTRRADEDNCAVILECISDHAKGVYEHFGFKSYLTYYFGVNEVNQDGLPDPKGTGFKADLMFYHKDGSKVLKGETF
ncbi:hypothetical protein TBLA_0A04790 [Henningerozyma blattae CBS 6284]|uniref:N-acetyltransferase domain-containing protein n=1 Tax=Henningerozyma blattae (strain ATCC 34711 / CBS 6284 / DSM 70876 / NBRC 10599 / NRRL Y-10934 / UCD 77-7) TaxID=1071380 RepID=I2GVX0_HENB6|nr:hypothetical protein TBLA_0A04790 [Tetrapisispora blattae CBS 6284]CCH58272.1 hypothetical protein TBLA_0A04790 [Tetrapisispora blattae CBS 6284]